MHRYSEKQFGDRILESLPIQAVCEVRGLIGSGVGLNNG